MEEINKIQSSAVESGVTILNKINEALKRFHFDGEWLRAPEFLPEYENLKGKRILIVEDIEMIIQNVLPEYIVATDGTADAILHSDQNLEKLADEILEKNPEVVLMDYTLANGVTGVEVMNALKNKGYSGKFLGFSSEGSREREFVRFGAIGALKKSDYPVSKTVLELARILRENEK